MISRWSVRSRRHAPRLAGHQPGRHVLGHLVDGAGREDVTGAERRGERPPVEDPGHGVEGRVAVVERQRFPAVLVDDPPQALLDRRERLVPVRLAQAVAVADQRDGEAIRVLVELADAGALRAQVATRERVVGVTGDRGDPVRVVERELEAADRLTQRTGPVGGPHRDCASSSPSTSR
jgi:hypothetical protein